MPSVNTTSVREELERMRLEFDRLSSAGKVAPETKMLFQSMFMLFELLVSVFVEKRVHGEDDPQECQKL